MGVKCKHYKLCPVQSKLVYFSQFWGLKHFLGPVCDIRRGQSSSEVKWGQLCGMATIFCQKKPWCKLRMMMTLMEVKGHQVKWVSYVLWLPYLVKRSTDASWEWWWPWWRSKFIRGQMGSTMWYGYHILSKEVLMQTENDDDLYGG